MKRLALMLVLLTIAVAFSACNKSVVGKYLYEKGNQKAYIELKPDGTFSYTERRVDDSVVNGDGTYQITGDTLTIKWSEKGPRQTQTFKIEGDILVAQEGDVRFVKQREVESQRGSQGSPSDSGKLTTAKAQEAVDKAIRQLQTEHNKQCDQITGSGKGTVQGIQELPQENAAQADLIYSDLKSLCAECIAGARWKNGKAIFKHYNDGRWVLTQLTTDDIRCWPSLTVNIEVK